ncbi:hypothetical protein BDV39DRAFT_48937 [Aspergillus sergii]|uniref:Uncharacterized protein n=1 Tax=Aspergillus sergii TaxID=1034303 RepID=A0A5N6X8E5_9EURO|nr:hypothetical protein BDV39DRAFT_48937 [Aspergillus sergii]
MPLYTFFPPCWLSLCNYTLCIEQKCFGWRLGTDVCCKYFSFFFLFLFVYFTFCVRDVTLCGFFLMKYSERRRPYTGYINASWLPTPEAAA